MSCLSVSSPAPLILRREDEEEARVVTRALDRFRDRQVRRIVAEDREARAEAGRSRDEITLRAEREVVRRGREQPQPAVVREGVELDLVDRGREFRHVVAQLDDALEAVIAEKLGWIIGAAKEAAAIAALLRDQERREGVLAVDRAERRERAIDRLRAAQRCLDLLEIDAAGEARRRRRVDGGRRQIGVCGAAEPLDALAEGDVDL